MTTANDEATAAAVADEQTDGQQAAGGKAEPSSARLILTLGFAGLVSGLALVGTYEGTLPMIKRNDAEALRKGVFKVVPGAVKMQKLRLSGGKLEPYTGGDPVEVIATYNKAGQPAGYAIVGEGPGFADMIKLIYGYDSTRRRIIGMQVLASLETPGLGDKILKDQHFVGCFKNLTVAPEVVAKKKGEATKDNEIDAITGATISSKAVVKIINAANKKWLGKLPAAGGEPRAAVDRRAGEATGGGR